MKSRILYLYTSQRHTEQDDAFQTLLYQWANEALKFVHTPPTLAGQSRNFSASIGIVGDENGIHEHGFCELALGLPFSRGRVGVAALEDGTEDVLGFGVAHITLRTHEMSIVRLWAFGNDEKFVWDECARMNFKVPTGSGMIARPFEFRLGHGCVRVPVDGLGCVGVKGNNCN